MQQIQTKREKQMCETKCDRMKLIERLIENLIECVIEKKMMKNWIKDLKKINQSIIKVTNVKSNTCIIKKWNMQQQ